MGLAPACAGNVVRYELAGHERLWNSQRGYSIDLPQRASGVGWREQGVEGADLAFRRPDGAALSLQTSCRKRRASPQILARHLTLGSVDERLLGSAPVELHGDSGWSQSFETREQDVVVHVKTVSVVGEGCVYDWVLVTREASAFEALEPIFDAWWQSFRRGITSDPRRVSEASQIEALQSRVNPGQAEPEPMEAEQ
jgi:hypothetical protein